jgi:hypothetical protein
LATAFKEFAAMFIQVLPKIAVTNTRIAAPFLPDTPILAFKFFLSLNERLAAIVLPFRSAGSDGTGLLNERSFSMMACQNLRYSRLSEPRAVATGFVLQSPGKR